MCLEKKNYLLILKKCRLHDCVIFLGFVVSAKWVQVDGEKIKAIQEWITPKTVSEVKSFHGLASFYRRFVMDFSTLAAPLNEIIKKHGEFKWEEKHEQAFVVLKHRLTNALILALPNFTKIF